MVPETVFPVGEWHLRKMSIYYLHADKEGRGASNLMFSSSKGADADELESFRFRSSIAEP